MSHNSSSFPLYNFEGVRIFTFVPYHQVSYTLNVECSDLSGIDVKFALVNFTF